MGTGTGDETETGPLWLREQKKVLAQRQTEVAGWQAVDANARGGKYAESTDPTIPDNSGTGVSILEHGARTKTLKPEVLWSPEQAQGKQAVEALRRAEKQKKQEGLQTAGQRLRSIISGQAQTTAAYLIGILLSGFLIYKLIGFVQAFR